MGLMPGVPHVIYLILRKCPVSDLLLQWHHKSYMAFQVAGNKTD